MLKVPVCTLLNVQMKQHPSNMSPEKRTEKPNLSRKQLQGHDIDYIDKVSDIDELDPWLRPICLTITRLQERFSRAARNTFNKELKQFRLHGQDRDDARRQGWCLKPVENPDYLQRENYTTSAAQGDHLKPESCEQALGDVRLCRVRNENENKWTQVLREHVFWDFQKANRGLGSYE
jgi:hypothetical protein